MQLGIILGGIIPAILFGITGIFLKVSAKQQVPIGSHLIAIGIGVVAVGVVLVIIMGQQDFTLKKLIPSFFIGSSWGTGMVLVTIALMKYGTPISVLAPLYNMNTLVTVILALVIFAEAKNANLWKLMLGSLFIVGGGILVAGSSKTKITEDAQVSSTPESN